MENIENSPLEHPPEADSPENIALPQAEISFLAKFKSKWPVVLGVLASIAIFTAIIYTAYSYGRLGQEVQSVPIPAVTPTIESQTGDWEIHRNSRFGWEFKYPQGWEVKPAEAGGEWADAEEAIYGDWISDAPGSTGFLFEIGITKTKGREKCYEFGDPNNEFETETVIYNDIKWVRHKGRGLLVNTFFNEETDSCITANSAVSNLNPQYLTIFDQILSTFKFVENQSVGRIDSAEAEFQGLVAQK